MSSQTTVLPSGLALVRMNGDAIDVDIAGGCSIQELQSSVAKICSVREHQVSFVAPDGKPLGDMSSLAGLPPNSSVTVVVEGGKPVEGEIRLEGEYGGLWDNHQPSNVAAFLEFEKAVEMRISGGDTGLGLEVKPLHLTTWDEFRNATGMEEEDCACEEERDGVDVERKVLKMTAAEVLWDRLCYLGRLLFPHPTSYIELEVPPFAKVSDVRQLCETTKAKVAAGTWPDTGTGYTKDKALADTEVKLAALLEIVEAHGSLADALVPGAHLPVQQAYSSGWDGNGGRLVFATAEYCFFLSYATG
mmetsp:Transcript_128122/g.255822  ORF Transcript_128122/g.255822 Transcript_128122/m.255822 type:complete len:303 (-) Transcript_128122:108-1016(-)